MDPQDGKQNYTEQTFRNTPFGSTHAACIRLLLYNNSNAYNVSTLTEIMSLNPPTTPQVVCIIRKLRLSVNTVQGHTISKYQKSGLKLREPDQEP